MKTIKFILPAFLLITFCSSAFSQKYRTASDTVKLNKEYVEVSNDIAELTSKLTIAQNNLPGFVTKAEEATTVAQNSADASSAQASKATNGNLSDAKSAKRKANKAFNRAEDARDAHNDTKDQDKRIANLTRKLQHKQDRLLELDEMRLAIRTAQ